MAIHRTRAWRDHAPTALPWAMARVALVCVVPDGTVPTDGTQPRVAEETLVEWPVGDSGDIGIEVQHADGSPYNLAGCTLTLVCRQHAADPIPALAYTATINSPGVGGGGASSAFTGVIDGGGASEEIVVSSSGTVPVQASHTKNMTAGALYWFDVRLVAADSTVWHVMPSSKWIPTMTVARAGEP